MKTPTVKRITPAEYLEVADPGVVLRSYASMRHVKPEVFNSNMRGALFDTGGVWPNVEALSIWCNQSTSDCVWAAKVILDLSREKDPGKIPRKLRFAKLEGANHFVSARQFAHARSCIHKPIAGSLGQP